VGNFPTLGVPHILRHTEIALDALVAALCTEAEVMDAVRRELGDAAADALLVSLADAPEAEAEQATEPEPRDPNATLN
jgi:hypothetical protein